MFADANALASAAPRNRAASRRLALLAAPLLALVLLTGFGWGTLQFARDVRRLPPPVVAAADGVVALTGGPDRIAGATALLAGGKAGRMLISGVNERTTRTELARENPRFAALVECCVDIGYAAENTQGNAVETARWSRRNGLRSLIVVTADFHMPRALAELRGALPEARLFAYPIRTPRLQPGQWWRDGEAMRLVAVEYAKYLRTLTRNALAPRQAGAASAPARG
ncbi:MAG: YdcF family protein [Methylobacteriaceae bacterium]|nr:YdcF family protein [Methylobacteriaceae bacterium]